MPLPPETEWMVGSPSFSTSLWRELLCAAAALLSPHAHAWCKSWGEMSAFRLGRWKHVEIFQEWNIPPNAVHKPKGGTLSYLQMLVCFSVILCCYVYTVLTLAIIKKRFLCL